MTNRKKALTTGLVVLLLVWAVIIAAWFRKADEAGVSSDRNDSGFIGVLALGLSIVAGVVIFASLVSGKKPPPPAWAMRDRKDFPEARVVVRED